MSKAKIKDKEQTRVIFRQWLGDNQCIALFPAIAGDMNPDHCSSYMHIGQHGAAHYSGVMRATRVASPEEYADLKRELEGLGYNLKVLRNSTRKDRLLRMTELDR